MKGLLSRTVIAAVALTLAIAAAPGNVAWAGQEQPEEAALETDHAFRQFIATLWPEARAHGVSRRTFDGVLAEIQVDWRVLERANAQPEHELSTADYVWQIASPARIGTGREQLARHAPVFGAVEAAYGVDRHVVAAIWGIESHYGQVMGEFSVVRALGMLAWMGGRRAEFGRIQLIEAMRIIQRGDVEPARMLGSWAGAMGHTQFIPTTYSRHAVDFDRDGRRDIWGTVADALGSTASYLKASGWQTGVPWGVEATLPAGFDFALMDRELPFGDWLSRGVTPVSPRSGAGSETGSGVAIDKATLARLLVPSGANGPVFLVTGNFKAILKYNNATAYALAVGHLSDRLAGGIGLARNWPANERPLRKQEREELQSLLIAQGLYKGEVDGLFGDQTKAALIAWQRQAGIVPDAYANEKILSLLKSGIARFDE